MYIRKNLQQKYAAGFDKENLTSETESQNFIDLGLA